MKKFKVEKSYNNIKEVDIIRETDSFVYVTGNRGKEIREAKNTNYDAYCDTFDEAKNCLLKISLGKIKRLEYQLEKEKETFENIEKLNQNEKANEN